MPKDSVCLLEQIRTLDKTRLKEKISYIGGKKMKDVDGRKYFTPENVRKMFIKKLF